MPPENDNPVGSMGSQGSQDFDSMITTPQGGSTPPPSQDGGGHPGENLGAQNDAAGKLPQKSLTPDAGQAPDGQGGQTAPSATPPAAQSQADIIRATAEAVAAAHVRGQQSQQHQPQGPAPKADLSPQEFQQKYNVTRANEELVSTILGQDPRKAAAALDQYGQNLVKQAILMTMELNEANLGKFREEVNPHLQSWQTYQRQQEAVAAEGRFFKAAPDLAGEKDLVMELKDAYLAKVQAGQIRFANEQEAFNAVANAARTILKRVNPAWGQGQSGGQQAPTTGQQPGRRMSVASTTGRSGTGQAAAKSDVDMVFGADAH
jgi:hypothetical protein